MNWPYVHTLINHFPIILMVVGTAVLLLALIVRRRAIWLYALATLTLAGLSIYPVYFTGDQAADAVRHTWYIMRPMVEEHDAAAGYALFSVLLAGRAPCGHALRLLPGRLLGALPEPRVEPTAHCDRLWRNDRECQRLRGQRRQPQR